MVSRKNRFLALMIALILAVLSLPLQAFAVDFQVEDKKGSDFSENTYIAGKIQQLLDSLVYSDTPYFTVMGDESCKNIGCTSCRLDAVCTNHPTLSDLGVNFDGTALYGSGAFVRYAFALIFETKLSVIDFFGNTKANIPLQRVGRVAVERSVGTPAAGVTGSYLVMNAENLKAVLKNGTPGDFIQARSALGGNHSMLLLAAGDETVTVLHSIDYAVEGIDYNKVVISEMTYEEMISSWNSIITLFRAEADVYAATWGKGETVHVTHKYTDETGNACAICGKDVEPLPSVSVSGAGAYIAKSETSSYESYYRSSAKKNDYAAGKWVLAFGSVVNSVGKT